MPYDSKGKEEDSHLVKSCEYKVITGDGPQLLYTERTETHDKFWRNWYSRTGTKLPPEVLKAALPKRAIVRKPVLRWKTVKLPPFQIEVPRSPRPPRRKYLGKHPKRPKPVMYVKKWVRGSYRTSYVKWIRDRSVSNRKVSLKGLDLPPNDLDYQKVEITDNGTHHVYTANAPWGPGEYRIEGDLLRLTHDAPNGNNTTALYANINTFSSVNWPDFMRDKYYNLAEERCIGKVLDRAKDAHVNLAQALGEYRQTAEMFGSLVTRIASAVKAIKSGNPAKLRRALKDYGSKDLANDTLLVQYGLRPLIADVVGVMKELARPEGEKFIDIIASETVERPRELIHEQKFGNFARVHDRVWSEGKVTVRHKYRFRVNRDGMRALSQLGITNLAELAWELTPHSFVVDWVLPIGDMLSRIDALQGLDFMHGHRTVVDERFITYERRMGYAAEEVNSGCTPRCSLVLTGYVKQFRCKRDRLYEPPSVPLPSLKDPISTEHLVNASALIRQLFK